MLSSPGVALEVVEPPAGPRFSPRTPTRACARSASWRSRRRRTCAFAGRLPRSSGDRSTPSIHSPIGTPAIDEQGRADVVRLGEVARLARPRTRIDDDQRHVHQLRMEDRGDLSGPSVLTEQVAVVGDQHDHGVLSRPARAAARSGSRASGRSSSPRPRTGRACGRARCRRALVREPLAHAHVAGGSGLAAAVGGVAVEVDVASRRSPRLVRLVAVGDHHERLAPLAASSA